GLEAGRRGVVRLTRLTAMEGCTGPSVRRDEEEDDAGDPECERRRPQDQKTGVSLHTPQTSRRASHISPMVTYALEASMIGGMRFLSSSEASRFNCASADSAAAESRRARSACTRAIRCASSKG